MEAILCSGLTDADGEKSSGGKIALPKGELLADVEPSEEKKKKIQLKLASNNS